MVQKQNINGIVRPVAPQLRKRTPRRYIVVGIVTGSVLAVSIVVWLLFGVPWNQQRILSDRYQAVYLTSSQIYFGKLQNTSGDFLTLKTPYVAQQSTDVNGDKATQSETSLVKVTQQVYGPDDSIALRTDQVQFWQNLRADSKIVQTIESAK